MSAFFLFNKFWVVGVWWLRYICGSCLKAFTPVRLRVSHFQEIGRFDGSSPSQLRGEVKGFESLYWYKSIGQVAKLVDA